VANHSDHIACEMRQYQLLMANSKKQSKACTKKAKMTILVLSHFTGYLWPKGFANVENTCFINIRLILSGSITSYFQGFHEVIQPDYLPSLHINGIPTCGHYANHSHETRKDITGVASWLDRSHQVYQLWSTRIMPCSTFFLNHSTVQHQSACTQRQSSYQ